MWNSTVSRPTAPSIWSLTVRDYRLSVRVNGPLADAAYDTVAFYEAAGGRGATVVVPPHKPARVSRRTPRSSARDRTIAAVKTIGRRRWRLPHECVSRSRSAARPHL